jgi:hypothetical protein
LRRERKIDHKKTLCAAVVLMMTVLGCAVAGVQHDQRSFYGERAYLDASKENPTSIERREIATGMTQDECKLPWRDRPFELVKVTSSEEVWKTSNLGSITYLSFRDGVLIDCSRSMH